MQVSAHKDAVSLFERYAKGGENAEPKDWAGKTLPALKHHLELAEASIRLSKLGRGAASQGKGGCLAGLGALRGQPTCHPEGSRRGNR
jgi:Domain of unknown function (DUF4142)